VKTDQLIDMLSTNLEPVKRGQVGKTLAWALIVGGAAAFCLMLTTVGLRAEPGDASHLSFLSLKLLFTLSVIGMGTALLLRLVRPGRDGRRLFHLTFLPFVVIGLAGAAALALERPMAWGKRFWE
jgi:hypothetical protein